MNELLAHIVEAHGGFDRWRRFNRVEATIVTGGALWGMKNLTQDQDPRRMRVSLHEEVASVAPFGDPDWHTEFTPDRVAILRDNGSVVTERRDPRSSFAGHEMTTPWDPLHRAYFNGYALWTYLTTPFLLTMDGVRVTEGQPWTEGTETWRVLRARFPASIATHSERQDFFFGDDLLLRRHDYEVDVWADTPAAHFLSDYVDVNGLKFPRQRTVFARRPDGRPDLDMNLVTIDLSEYTLF